MENQTLPEVQPEQVSKQGYRQPRLTNYGDMSSLTQFNNQGVTYDGDPFSQAFS